LGKEIALFEMSTTCVRCSRLVEAPAESVLCAACRARLRLLLSPRAFSLRGQVHRSRAWPLGIAMLAALALTGGQLCV
jgi:hypothetical protein